MKALLPRRGCRSCRSRRSRLQGRGLCHASSRASAHLAGRGTRRVRQPAARRSAAAAHVGAHHQPGVRFAWRLEQDIVKSVPSPAGKRRPRTASDRSRFTPTRCWTGPRLGAVDRLKCWIVEDTKCPAHDDLHSRSSSPFGEKGARVRGIGHEFPVAAGRRCARGESVTKCDVHRSGGNLQVDRERSGFRANRAPDAHVVHRGRWRGLQSTSSRTARGRSRRSGRRSRQQTR